MIATWLAPLGLLSKKPAFQLHSLRLFVGLDCSQALNRPFVFFFPLAQKGLTTPNTTKDPSGSSQNILQTTGLW